MDLRSLLGPVFPIVEPFLGWVVGMDYPETDADQCQAQARVLRAAAEQCRTAGPEGDEALRLVLQYASGPAADTLSAYWKRYTTEDPVFLETLAASSEDAADRLERYGLDSDYTQKYIALCLVLLAFVLLRTRALAPLTGGRSLMFQGPACRLARLNVRIVAKMLLLSIAFMTGLDAGVQVWQIAEGKRHSWDGDKTVAALEGGLLTGLAFVALGAGVVRLGGPRMLGGEVLKADMTGRERVAAWLTHTMGGVATQSAVASVIGSLPMLMESGQLTPENLAKALVSGFVGGVDGRAGRAEHVPLKSGAGLDLPHVGEAPRLGEAAFTGKSLAGEGPDGTALAGLGHTPKADAHAVAVARPEAPAPGGERALAGAGVAHHFGGADHPGHAEPPAGVPHDRTTGHEGGRGAPELAEAHREIVRQSRVEVDAGLWYREPGRHVLPTADMRLLRPTEGVVDVGIQADRDGFVVGDRRLSARDVGTMLAHDPKVMADPDAKIRLIACDVGQNRAVLQEIADITGRQVIAADKYVYIGADRLPHTGGVPEYRPDGRPVFREDGSWHHVQPERPHEQPAVPMDLPRQARELPRGPIDEAELKARLELGRHRVSFRADGQHGVVQLVRFHDGLVLIRKLHTYGQVTLIKDLLASLVGRAVGAPVPHIVRDPFNREAVYMQFVDGTPAEKIPPMELHRYFHGEGGKRLGLLDMLVSNTDGRHRNWFGHGGDKLTGLDLSRSFSFAEDKAEFAQNDFSRHYMDIDGEWIDNPLTRAEMESIVEEITALRPAFEETRRLHWYESMLDNLYHVSWNAMGDAAGQAAPVHHFGYADAPTVFDRIRDQAQAIFQTRWRVADVVPLLFDSGGSRRAFGLELEYSLPGVAPERHPAVNEAIARALHEAGLSRDRRVLDHHVGHERGYDEDASGWWVEDETSVGVAGEVVSPILRDTPATWRNLARVVEIIRAHGGEVRMSVGGHIHVGTPDYRTVVNYLKLLDNVRGNQDILFRLAQNPLAEGGLHRGFEQCVPNIPKPGLRPYYFGALAEANGATSAVSMTEVRGQVGDHVQFRLFDGTLEPGVIQAQVRLVLALADGTLAGQVDAGPPEPVGHHRERGDDSESFRRLLDELPLREIDREQLISLYAITHWQPSMLDRHKFRGQG
ncbi:hypothetical protein HTZ77_41155 [Nonomuraea sp. SMC257]|uniref:Outer membrane channel protein CpnT-like N-terminal domain-containing protein n=1 Tax=Nonomuraea montanisoli TaxID=2741721 RepID=A0A7Y6IGK8_9ACTN|nr:hypothetical protein [Nonomuraea montanisoli]NUW37767.1 hypothetical protein [Nonomuraea montanisoli]